MYKDQEKKEQKQRGSAPKIRCNPGFGAWAQVAGPNHHPRVHKQKCGNVQ